MNCYDRHRFLTVDGLIINQRLQRGLQMLAGVASSEPLPVPLKSARARREGASQQPQLAADRSSIYTKSSGGKISQEQRRY